MPYTTHESEENVVLEPATTADAAVIWLHGLGADGYDFVPIVDELRLPPTLAVRFIFPHARPRPVTINNGFVMRAWYDITGLGPDRKEDDAGIRESAGVVNGYIEQQNARGVATERIVIAGFSQGGAIALQASLRYPERLGGVMALSTYLPLRESVAAEASRANKDLPILMCHGLRDPMIAAAIGKASRDQLVSLGYTVEWQSYPMEHQVCMEEVHDISRWLQARLESKS
ncbi:MAG TPA: alpha/beta hydrolase-fold protein [Steroidobacteraceae bacterium]|jgi:phospholipase/carboxylesterase|nr:alpha/beta hydrolase-fold protein [Steroidobacteraceae bacterium]